MASKNQVTLTFAGDSSDLDKSFDRVGKSAEDMGKDVDKSADRFNKVGESADNLDTRAMGMRDTFTGVQDTFQAFNKEGATMQERALLLGMGMGDLASGVANFGTQFAKQVAGFAAGGARMVASMATTVASTVAGWVVMGVQALANAAVMAAAWLISLGPIGLVIAAIGLIIGILVALGVGFDDIANVAKAAWDFIWGAIKTVFDWLKTNWPLVLAIITGPIGLAVLFITKHWDTIKDGFTAVKDWIGDRIGDIVGFFTGLPGRLASVGSGLFNFIKDSYRNAINFVIRGWNSLEFSIPGFDPPGPGSFPGFTVGTPDIPTLHTGGVFRAPRGQREGLAMLLDGETVSRPGQSSDGMTVVVNVAGSIRSDRELVEVVRNELDRGGFGGAFT